MKLRKILTLSLLFLSATIIPVTGAEAFVNKGPVPANNPVATEARAQALLKRLEEIKAMDFASMPKSEKRKIRREVRSITKEVRQINDGGGVYVSVGGIIIILLLLILLL